MFRSTNPTLSENNMENIAQLDGAPMSLSGAINKTMILGVIMALSGGVVWYQYTLGYVDKVNALMMGGLILGLIVALITTFKKELSPYLAPVYAFCEGAALGGLTVMFESAYPGIAIQAIAGTFMCIFSMGILYKTGLIKVTDKFRSTIMIAMGGILILYLFNFVMSFFGKSIPVLYSSSPIGIGISVVICLVAAFSLLLDFDLIERAANNMMPKYMEWYCAFSLMVTIVWLYVEILNLLAKMRNK